MQDTTTPLKTVVDAVEPSPFSEGIMPAIEHVWNYKLFTVNTTTITVSQITVAVLVLLFGLLLSKIVSRRVGHSVLPKMKVDTGPAAAIQSILYYLLITLTVVAALQIAGVPLTIFTIFGGAIALGIGFGSQNIINNFISGLLLLIERPIHVGHLVRIAGDWGVVRKIGARSTHLDGYDGATYIVPNSILLENTVTNWNINDTKVRSMIGVGVAYGSDTGMVRQILEQSIEKNGQVIQSKDNRVLFCDFGDNALGFEVHFWTRPKSVLDKNTIESDVRFAIDEACRKQGISIAFPQRDIHLDTIKPLDIRVLREKSDG